MVWLLEFILDHDFKSISNFWVLWWFCVMYLLFMIVDYVISVCILWWNKKQSVSSKLLLLLALCISRKLIITSVYKIICKEILCKQLYLVTFRTEAMSNISAEYLLNNFLLSGYKNKVFKHGYSPKIMNMTSSLCIFA